MAWSIVQVPLSSAISASCRKRCVVLSLKIQLAIKIIPYAAALLGVYSMALKQSHWQAGTYIELRWFSPLLRLLVLSPFLDINIREGRSE